MHVGYKFTITGAASPKHIEFINPMPMEDDPKVTPGIFEIKDNVLTLGIGSGLFAPAKLEPERGTTIIKLARFKKDPLLKDFDGVWELVSSETDGMLTKMDPDVTHLVVHEEGMRQKYKNKEVDDDSYYTLVEKNGVLEIDISVRDYKFTKDVKLDTYRGICEIKEDQLKICWATKPENPRPTAFAAPRGGETTLEILKRKK